MVVIILPVCVCVCEQLPGGGEATLHAHPPTQTPGAENRRPVHSETPVRPFPQSKRKRASVNQLPGSVEDLHLAFRFLVKLQEFNYQLKVKALFDK